MNGDPLGQHPGREAMLPLRVDENERADADLLPPSATDTINNPNAEITSTEDPQAETPLELEHIADEPQPAVSHIADTEDGSDFIPSGNGSSLSAQRREDIAPIPNNSSPASPWTPTLQEKLSVWGIIVFSVGTVFMLASMGVLAFLWFADETNTLWKDVMLRNWATRAVAICAEVVKQAMGFQTAVVTAMLASLALERAEPAFAHVASVSMMRATAGSGTVLVLLWNYLVGFRWARFRSTVVFSLAITASIVFACTQVISILLLSDIDLTTMSGNTVAVERAFSFSSVFNTTDARESPLRSIQRVGTWFTNTKAASYPAFAEYSEPPYTAEGVSDTGVTLRALLPFQAPQDRQMLKTYSGFATVMDARVTCQIPTFVRPRVQILSQMSQVIVFEGAVQASRYTPRLGNATLDTSVGPDTPIPFSCLAPPGPNRGDNTYGGFDDGNAGWWLAICQLPNGEGNGKSLFAGGLISEFRDTSEWTRDMANMSIRRDESRHGAAYLIVNVTTGNQGRWKAAVTDDTRGRGYSPPAYSYRNEWLDLVFSNGGLVLSTTLCYTAFQFGELPVTISSVSNRTEPAPVFAPQLRRYIFDNVRTQLGQDRSVALQDRRLLRLEKQPWVIPDDGSRSLSFMRRQADLSRTAALATAPNGNVSAFMTRSTECPSPFGNGTLQQIEDMCVTPELEYLWLMQEILMTGGSMAFALQSLLTTLSAAAYYDQMGQFDNVSTVEQTFFTIASAPTSSAGFWVVAATVAAHLILSTVVLVLFLQSTNLSRVGATWAVLAQAAVGEGERYLGQAHSRTDVQLQEMMKADGVRETRAGLRRVDDRVEVFVRAK
ncbi:hypothetical protein B0T16DRAFT_200847 [Cercophora newfieldiana]|uniref:Uncharacterized protein n=1 Tax=Cercophora newfieldiana TaxID=92897 RepID=A0AA39XUU3_9PEZI|nr:hypothetical protein B0T16DRAFT_200847 [Cercophora newfieldiana]